ncbi:MAG: hypothetical protein H6661_05315 [Ardenticatenaceae bacterium]|nr:hypothetical protein [Ardenticatenaceae bacterium]
MMMSTEGEGCFLLLRGGNGRLQINFSPLAGAQVGGHFTGSVVHLAHLLLTLEAGWR